jgi:hypothetical protein
VKSGLPVAVIRRGKGTYKDRGRYGVPSFCFKTKSKQFRSTKSGIS